jgi:hypothetical protein
MRTSGSRKASVGALKAFNTTRIFLCQASVFVPFIVPPPSSFSLVRLSNVQLKYLRISKEILSQNKPDHESKNN